MAGEGYAVIRDALRKTGKVGLGREWLVAVAPLEDGLVMELVRYADELRDPAEYFDEVPSAKPQKELIDLAVQLVDEKSGSFEPKKIEDHYGTARGVEAQRRRGALDRGRGRARAAGRSGRRRTADPLQRSLQIFARASIASALRSGGSSRGFALKRSSA